MNRGHNLGKFGREEIGEGRREVGGFCQVKSFGCRIAVQELLHSSPARTHIIRRILYRSCKIIRTSTINRIDSSTTCFTIRNIILISFTLIITTLKASTKSLCGLSCGCNPNCSRFNPSSLCFKLLRGKFIQTIDHIIVQLLHIIIHQRRRIDTNLSPT